MTATAVVVFLLLAHLMGDFYGAFYGPIVPHLRERLGMTLTQTTALACVYTALSNFMQPLFGILGERAERRRIMAAGILCAAIGMSFLGLAGSFPTVCMALLLGGIGVGMFHPCGAAIAGRQGGERRSGTISLYMVGGNVGIMLAPLVVPRVASYGLEWLALLCLLGIAFAPVLWLALPPERQAPGGGLPAALAGIGPVFRKVWPIHLDVVLRFIAVTMYAVMLPLFGTLRGQDPVEAGNSLALFMLAGALGVVAGGYSADRFSGRALLVAGELAAGACLLVAPMTHGVAFQALLVVGAFTVYAVTPLQIAAAQRLAPGTESAASGIVMGLAYGNASILLLPLGWLGDYWKIATGSELIAVGRMLQVSACALFLAALVAVALRVEAHEVQREGPDA